MDFFLTGFDNVKRGVSFARMKGVFSELGDRGEFGDGCRGGL